MNAGLVWDRDGADWPNRNSSRFIRAAGLQWHVQIAGSGPVALLLHGTGASTHSWRRLMPILAGQFTVVAPDLPGHGFTSTPDAKGLSLAGMAREVSDLMRTLALQPDIIVGHSAGAAVGIRATIDHLLTPRAIISINGALLPFGSLVGQLFSPIARLLASAPMVPQIMAWRGQSRAAVERVLSGTGSKIAPRDLDYYARLFKSPSHVAGALGMMANWDLKQFADDLPKLDAKLVLIAATDDKTISPADAAKVALLVPHACVVSLGSAGHLAHEERPEEIAEITLAVSRGLD
ncbi:alpha/beta fold hydrolase BchO [Hyphomicrobium sp. ghe19]|uniref:alpha/beta fold hydrolase BchO n=1 Tax=Hyphomicrobium sp. ghe19 TaxID=2682968 RepID=UPI0013671CCB|nr:Fluoroacetate dehalogenase [Hyphomicrobium sp. ghe19]